MKLMFHASAPVNADVAAVRGLIDSGWVLQRFFGGLEPPLSPEQLARYLDVDSSPGKIGFQGHWWYRGEIDATEQGGQACINYRVYNIAKWAAWAVPLANRMFIGYDASVTKAAKELAHAIEAQLRPSDSTQRP